MFKIIVGNFGNNFSPFDNRKKIKLIIESDKNEDKKISKSR
jgi:hypothetical protein